MKITNKNNLPQPIVDAVKNDGYDRGSADITVTELSSPPRKATLTRRHFDEMEEDASNRIWSLLGQSIHTILERANKTGIAERRLSIQVDGWKLSGGMDLYLENGTLIDYKTTNAHKFKNGMPADTGFEEQLNVYAEILRQNGDNPKELWVVAILRDWAKSRAWANADYPQEGVVTASIPLWESARAKKYISERVALHKAARDAALPLCTSEERWAKPDIYSVLKPGGKRSLKNSETKEEALGYMEVHNKKGDMYIEKRPGENTRCLLYCSAAPFCSQWKLLNQGETKNETT